MHGRIISYDAHTRFGQLADANGKQHSFPVTEWLGQSAPQAGQPVAFDLVHGSAIAVTPTGPAPVGYHGAGDFGAPSSSNPLGNAMNYAGEALRGAQNPFGVPSSNAPPTVWQFYFSPTGRVSLGQYWKRFALPFGGAGLIIFAAAMYCVYLAFHQRLPMIAVFIALAVVMLKLSILGWISFVMHIKRYHDLGMSWGSAWVVDTFMPFGRDYMTWRVLFQQGVMGPNQFGPDPREWG
jgi:uncharacterized membrane protein YhaH (DUF805 family)